MVSSRENHVSYEALENLFLYKNAIRAKTCEKNEIEEAMFMQHEAMYTSRFEL